MFYSPINRIDNSPYSLWDAKVVQDEMTRITNSITDLATRLMNTNTAQTINGQKTFSDLYFKDQNPTYGTVMDWINHDISPVFGAGAVAFSREGGYEECRFTKPNVSGVVMDMALKNPIFSQNYISITGGTDNRDALVLKIDAPNVPLAAFDSQKLGLPPSAGKGQVQPYYWATSKDCSGTIRLDGLGENVSAGTARYMSVAGGRAPYYIVAAYNEEIDKVDLIIADKGKFTEFPSNYKAMSILSQIYTGANYGLQPYQNETCREFINGILYFHRAADYNELGSDNLSYLDYYTNQTCIAQTMIYSGQNIKINGGSFIPPDNSPPGEISMVQAPLSAYSLYIPIIQENGSGPSITSVPSKGEPLVSLYNAARILKLITGKYFL
jgi:hypothetical protein